MIFIGLAVGILIGALAAMVIMGRRAVAADVETRTLRAGLTHRDEQIQALADRHENELRLLRADEAKLKDQMKLISSDVLEKTSQKLADQMAERRKQENEQARTEMEKRSTEIKTVVSPVTDQLKQVQAKVE